MLPVLLLLLAASLLSSCRPGVPPPASSSSSSSSPTATGTTAPAQELPRSEARRAPKERKRGSTGRFDFYVMSMSWSPGFCNSPAGRNDNTQCAPGRQFGFVLHGLWPQYEERGWPQDCSTQPLDNAVVDRMLPIMPSPRLIRHEWSKHGTCSGLDPAGYFDEASEAFMKVKVPEKYKAPIRQVMVDPDVVQRDFAAANPSFPAGSFVALCSNNGRFFQEVRACFDKSLNGRECNREVARGACRSDQVIMQPVR